MDIEDRYEDDNSPRVAWCVGCDAPVELDERGQCKHCEDDFAGEDIALLEPLPPTSPRSIECPTCGEDRGNYCRVDDSGNGYNHAARVDQHARENQVIS